MNSVHLKEIVKMIKSFITLIRGSSYEASQNIIDANALTLLRQQIRDSTKDIENARKSIAIAQAQNKHEAEELLSIKNKIQDLEGRVVEAIEQGKTELAHEGAEAIAILQDEQDEFEANQDKFERKIALMKKRLSQSEGRLRELQRGLRLAEVTDKTQRLGQSVSLPNGSTIKEAEETLARLTKKQAETDAIESAMESDDLATGFDQLSQKMADEGCGSPMKSRAEDVLKRLSSQTQQA